MQTTADTVAADAPIRGLPVNGGIAQMPSVAANMQTTISYSERDGRAFDDAGKLSKEIRNTYVAEEQLLKR